jgi:hypothetical protein
MDNETPREFQKFQVSVYIRYELKFSLYYQILKLFLIFEI